MSLKTSIEDRIDRLMERTWKSDDTGHTWHSRGFHRYFEGYKENKVVDEKNHEHVERFYAGNYYVSKLGTPTFVFARILYGLLIAASFAAYYTSCFSHLIEANYVYAVSIAQGIDVVLYLWLAYIYCCYLLGGRKMTSGEYKAGPVRIQQVCGALGIALLATGLAKFLVAAFDSSVHMLEIEDVGLMLLSAGCLFLICLLEKKTEYCLVSSGNENKEGLLIQ